MGNTLVPAILARYMAKQGPKRPKTAFLGHKRVWWLQTGGTKWNKGGTSQGTSTVMHWNSFGGQGGPYGCARGPPKRSKMAKTAFLGHKRIWWPPKGTPDPRNGSIELPRMCPDLFHLFSTLFRQSGATTPPYGTKITILGHLGPFTGLRSQQFYIEFTARATFWAIF